LSLGSAGRVLTDCADLLTTKQAGRPILCNLGFFVDFACVSLVQDCLTAGGQASFFREPFTDGRLSLRSGCAAAKRPRARRATGTSCPQRRKACPAALDCSRNRAAIGFSATRTCCRHRYAFQKPSIERLFHQDSPEKSFDWALAVGASLPGGETARSANKQGHPIPLLISDKTRNWSRKEPEMRLARSIRLCIVQLQGGNR